MTALETRYHQNTNRVSCRRIDGYKPESGRAETVYAHVPSRYASTQAEAHWPAVMAYARAHAWDGCLVAGGTERGFVWVFVPPQVAQVAPPNGFCPVFTLPVVLA